MLDFSRNGGASGACPGHVFLSVHKLFLTYVSFFVVFICPVWVCVGNKLYMPQIQTLFFLHTDYVLFSHFLLLPSVFPFIWVWCLCVFIWSLLFPILFWRLVPHVVFYNFASLLCSFPALVFKKYYFIYWFLFFHKNINIKNKLEAVRHMGNWRWCDCYNGHFKEIWPRTS